MQQNKNNKYIYVFLKSKKYEELSDFENWEVRIATLLSIITSLIMFMLIKELKIEEINNLLRSLTKDFAIAFIGFLGVVISGLAIFLATLNSKFIKFISNNGKIKKIENILLSFYLLAIVVVGIIIANLLLYIVTFFDCNLNYIITIILTLLISYNFYFILLYSIALIGNSIDIFFIVSKFDNIDTTKNKVEDNIDNQKKDKKLYDDIRLTVIESVLFSEKYKTEEKLKLYLENFYKYIDIATKDEIQRRRIKKMLDDKFRN